MGKRLVQQKEKEVKGKDVYKRIGYTILGCGIGWIVLLLFVMLLPQDYEKYNIGMFVTVFCIIAGSQIFLGLLLIFLAKHNQKFQKWTDKDIASFGNKERKRAGRA